jgi:hypothetical protein
MNPQVWYPRNLRSRFGDGTEDAAKAAEDAKAAEEAAKVEAAKGKTFTQAELDNIIKQRLGKEKDEKAKLVKDLKAAQDHANMTKEEKEQLAKRIEEYEASLLSKEEQIAKEKTTLERKHANDLKKHQEESSLWQQRYHMSMIQRSLADAASDSNAESSDQIIRMFGSDTYLSEDRGEDGKTLGTFTPKLKFKGLGEDKKMVEMDLPVGEAVKKIREDGLFANLFKHGGTPGTGTKGSGTGGGSTTGEPTIEMFGGNQQKYSEAYQAWRRTHNLDGTVKEKK